MILDVKFYRLSSFQNHKKRMAQYEDHIWPVFFVFLGLLVSGGLSFIQMCCHHDRPFQLLSSQKLRLNIVLGIASPFLLVAEFIVFEFASHFDSFSQNEWLTNFLFLSIPVFPLILGIFACIQNIRLTSPHSRAKLVDPFVQQANEDEEMLLASQMEGIPRTSAPILEDRQAFSIIDKHLQPIFFTSAACIVLDFAAAVPWIRHLFSD
ncbi:hypothetical protein TRFO_41584 [Tritrichomonas foetus]|uniref:Transmembrane protein n=1 Tax=Tritrichomonas foetus TaxID=1144522 RepID=A0A1J4L030_9EUKA|nr:hypothetical protein TRFO_41584 [Tritrichomonas foetus]|eukprot:OHT16770.1 hypothetical protein TRFO_41584 [Tritrichomonas foetus]